MTGWNAAGVWAKVQQAAGEGRSWIRSAGRTVSYAALRERVERVAGLAGRRGLILGDRVVIATADDEEAALLFAALVLNGLTAVTLDPDMGGDRARSLIERADPALLIIDVRLVERWSVETHVPVVPIEAAAPSKGLFGQLRKARPTSGLAAELDQSPREAPPSVIPPETLAYILFTSGTTQQPKGVSISHRALFAHLGTLSEVYGYGPDSAILNTLMLSHADGMIQGPVIAMANGAVLHRPVKFEISAIGELLDAVFRLRITHMVAVPTMLSLMVKLAAGDDDAFRGGDFRLMISCGAALDAWLWEAVEDKFGVSLLNLYGLTETVAGGAFAGEIVGARRPGSIGKPIDCELRIVDETGSDVPDGETGELMIRGDLVMSGYFQAPEMTAEVLGADGWLRTGDIALRAADGLYEIAGRKKNIVIRGGLNIQPEEVAEVIGRHPAVNDAIAFGLPDRDWGERLVAMAGASGVSEDELLRYCAEHLEPRKVPSRILVSAELPKGRSGKVSLPDARQLYDDLERAGGVSPTADRRGDADVRLRVFEIAAGCFRVDAASLDAGYGPQDVLGWDSMAHMNFVIALEEAFGLEFTPREVMSIDRLDKAVSIVLQR